MDQVNQDELLKKLIGFGANTRVSWGNDVRSWKDHTVDKKASRGFTDEDILVRPVVFPKFAEEFLGFTVGVDLAAETTSQGGRPDFTPSERVSCPFVFECKGSNDPLDLKTHRSQISGYLDVQWVKQVVLINMVRAVVYERVNGEIEEVLSTDLRGLYREDFDVVRRMTGDVNRFAQFVRQYSAKKLSTADKIDNIRRAPQWTALDVTDADWVIRTVDSVVQIVLDDVITQIRGGTLADPTVMTADTRSAITEELRGLASRLEATEAQVASASLDDFVAASSSSPFGKALGQYASQVAYWLVTKMLLIRIWEDSGIIKSPSLFDGGFDQQMIRFDDEVASVLKAAMQTGQNQYPAMFTDRAMLSWYQPTETVAVDALYRLANTYFGEIHSDILGQVYERTLERIDRKLLGQYYTPRDIIELIWDLVLTDDLSAGADREERSIRVLDIATGSGGFLVEGLARQRRQFEKRRAAGASLKAQAWINRTAESFNGVEKQPFSAFLAEINLLMQFSVILADEDGKNTVPELGILCADTLSLHSEGPCREDCDSRGRAPRRQSLAHRIKNTGAEDWFYDIALGNPPYIGQKDAAAVIQQTRDEHPYWEQFVGPHLDYLYWFVILGVSKLRPGGRFGFITTDYWLRAAGAEPMRQFLADNCHIDRIIRFGDMRLFPDAPGQHNLVITGTRTDIGQSANLSPPDFTIYNGPNPAIDGRPPILDVIRRAARSTKLHVSTHRPPRTPNDLGGASWAELAFTPSQRRARKNLTMRPSLKIDAEQGVLSSANTMRAGYDAHLPADTLHKIGWPNRKAGIFVLTSAEVAELGQLSDIERAILRPFVNTSDVLPYATIPAEPQSHLIYLPAPEGADRDTPLPSTLNSLAAHLKQFRGLLQHKVEQYNEDRPWWALHRPRPEILAKASAVTGNQTRWADYCLMPNWGSGGAITVGLAPAGSVPAQGLNALLPPSGIPAAYIAAVLNSTLVQQVGDSIPAGYLRKTDLADLSVPNLDQEVVAAISAAAIVQADLVHSAMARLSERFPLLRDALRGDPTLASATFVNHWAPAVPSAIGLDFKTAPWIDSVEVTGNQNQRIAGAQIIDDEILGLAVLAHGANDASTKRIRLELGTSRPSATAVRDFVAGQGSRGATLKHLDNAVVPYSMSALLELWETDHSQIVAFVDSYRTGRAAIDVLLSA